MFEFTFRASPIKLDVSEIQARVERETKKNISISLARVRREMLRSVRRSQKPSLPGMPPKSRSRAGIRQIFYEYDKRTRSGVVGPVKLGGGYGSHDKPVPQLLEFGGTVELKRDTSFRQRKRGKSQFSRLRRGQRIQVKARPTAGPALERVNDSGGLLSPWANIVRP